MSKFLCGLCMGVFFASVWIAPAALLISATCGRYCSEPWAIPFAFGGGLVAGIFGFITGWRSVA